MATITRRVLVVDDEQIIAALLVQVLQSAGFQAIAAHDVLAARTLVEEFDPDAVLLDIELGDGPSGLDLAHVLHQQHPHLAIMFLTRQPDLRFMGMTAQSMPEHSGFLRKDMIGDAGYLLEAVEGVLVEQGHNYRHDTMRDHPLAGLTSGQLEVLRLASLGLTNAAIAAQRGVSERAVEKSLQAVFGQLGIANEADINPRVEAVRLYIRVAGVPTRS